MRYYIIAGERSGDLHAGNLAKALMLQNSENKLRGMGGENMQDAGVELYTHYSSVSFMGFLEVFLNLRKISKVLNAVKSDLLEWKPDAIILVDFAGFNLKVAAFAKKHNIPVYYYISPKVWAWNQKRALKIKKLVDHMFVILPFEKPFFAKFGFFDVDYVGNPLLDEISQFQKSASYRGRFPADKNLVAVLAGSRKQEVTAMSGIVNQLALDMPKVHFVVAGVDNLDPETYNLFQTRENLELVFGETYDLLSSSDASITTSGTATLETALLNCPQVVVYRTSPITYSIAKSLIKVPFISLVNLIADKEIVTELIQSDFNPGKLKSELEQILPGGDKRDLIFEEYQIIKQIMGKPGASEKTAELLTNYLSRK